MRIDPPLEHYLYFPTESAARAAACELEIAGYVTKRRLAAIGDSWLVLAIPQDGAGDPSIARPFLEEVAGRFDGEYDGWEAQISEST